MSKRKTELSSDFEILRDFGFTKNEIHAYLAIVSIGLSEVKEICSRTSIPTSKIYNILDKLEKFGLIEVQNTRPKKCRPVNTVLALERLEKVKRKQYQDFKEKLPEFKKFLESRIVKFDDSSIFWSVAVNEEEIVKKHISQFQFVDLSSSICIPQNLLDLLRRKYNVARDITMLFKNKRIVGKLLITYQGSDQKSEISKWIDFRPRKIDSKNQIRVIEEFIEMPFGLFDFDKVLLLIRHPVKKSTFLSSLYMTNRGLYEDLNPVFEDLWDRADEIH